MDENKKWDLVIRGLSGEASAEEVEALKIWLSDSPANQEFYEEVKSLWNDSATTLTRYEYGKEDAYRLLQGRIKEAELTQAPFATEERVVAIERQKKDFGWLKIAASWLFISVAAFSVYWLINRKSAYQNQWLTATSEVGKKTKIFLPDSSLVWLNANTTIRYPRQFSSKHRDVLLSGEAFFEVKENTQSPFTVVSTNVATRVVGTSFNVKAYKNEAIEITVATGKVAVHSFDTLSSAPLHAVTLTPNQKAVFSTNYRQAPSVLAAPAHVAYSWKDGRLIFRGVPFQEVAHTLERWYGVHFVMESQTIASKKFTALFQPWATLDEVLEGLSLTKKVAFQKSGPNEIRVTDTIKKKLKRKTN